MLCRDRSMIAAGATGGGAIPIKCRAWTCEYCAPERRRRLIAQGISGKPRRFMTITRRRGLDESPTEAARTLAKGWRQLARLIRKELNKPPAQRWQLADEPREPEEQKKLEFIIRKDDINHKPILEYLCVLEAHKSGWPHMHLLLRTRYIPHDWLTQKATKLLQSKVIGISYVKTGHSPAAYVAKYVGKSPHKFGTLKRYWMTSKYQQEKNTDAGRVFPDCWRWVQSSDDIPTIRRKWISYGREPRDIRGGGIAWGWWISELEEHASSRRRRGAKGSFAPHVVDNRHSARARSLNRAGDARRDG